ncbi:MAG: peptide ABC transporter substrate-binding protein [Chlamydiota bacterium]
MKKKSGYYLAWLLVFLANLSLLGGCMKKPKENQSSNIPNEDILKFNFVIGDVPSLNPHELGSGGRGVALGKWLFEGLTRLNPKGEHELAGAEKVEISPCKTRYTFTLKSNHFSNGSPVTAHDYERSWKRALALDSKCSKAHLFYYIKNAEKAKKGALPIEQVGIKALDKKTLLVELNHPTPYFLNLLSSPLFAPFQIDREQIVSCGPYMVEERKKDDYLLLKASPFFWDADQISIKKVKVFMIQDAMTAFSLYEKKDIDWIGDPFSYLPSEILCSEIDKGTLFRGPDVVFPYWVYMNTEHFPVSSPLIRYALHCVIDRNEIAGHLLTEDEALHTPLPTPFGPSSPNYNLEKGRALFEQALKELGLTRKTFPTLKISSASTTLHRRLAEYLQGRWQSTLGIKVDLDVQEWSTFYANIAKGNYQIGGFFTSGDYSDPVSFLELLARENNFSRWEHAQYREVIEQLKRTSDSRLRSQLLAQAEEILKKEIPIIWIVNRVQYHAYRPNLKGLCFDQRGMLDLRWAYFE